MKLKLIVNAIQLHAVKQQQKQNLNMHQLFMFHYKVIERLLSCCQLVACAHTNIQTNEIFNVANVQISELPTILLSYLSSKRFQKSSVTIIFAYMI